MSVVVPTLNEAGNVAVLVERLAAVASQAELREVVFVDDSTDDTPLAIERLQRGRGEDELPVRLIHRDPGQRRGGLSGAVVTGIQAAEQPWVLVMDGDLQHPPEDIPQIVAARSGRDVVVASRYCPGGEAAGLASTRRRLVSKVASWLAAATFPRRLRGRTDTMTGFFAVRRSALDVPALRPTGFKILLEILARQELSVTDVPFRFASRQCGTSKAQLGQGLRFIRQLGRLRMDSWTNAVLWRVNLFALVGLICLVLDTAVFNLLLPFEKPLTAKLISSAVAIVASYFLNARLTWRQADPQPWRRQLAAFAAVSVVGLGISEACLLVSHYVFGLRSALADNISANVVGVGLGMLWRYVGYERWVFKR